MPNDGRWMDALGGGLSVLAVGLSAHEKGHAIEQPSHDNDIPFTPGDGRTPAQSHI